MLSTRNSRPHLRVTYSPPKEELEVEEGEEEEEEGGGERRSLPNIPLLIPKVLTYLLLGNPQDSFNLPEKRKVK